MMPKSLWLWFLLCFGLSFGQKPDSTERFLFRHQQIYVPAALMTAGILSDNTNRKKITPENGTEAEHLLGFTNGFDDYAQFAPMLAVYGFQLAGMTPKTDWANRTAILVKGQAINLGLVYVLKKTLKKTRPDGTAYSFPSGHTANVFAGATMLSIEYGEDYRWVPYVSYGFAAGIGVMRMVNDKHYISDVLFGAGLGILSMKFAYWTHQYQWNRTRTKADPFTAVYHSVY